MTTQSTVHPDILTPSARKASNDGHAEKDTNDTDSLDLKTRLRNAVDSGRERVSEWKGGFQDGIRERPIQSVLIAAAVGAALGMLLGRRSR